MPTSVLLILFGCLAAAAVDCCDCTACVGVQLSAGVCLHAAVVWCITARRPTTLAGNKLQPIGRMMQRPTGADLEATFYNCYAGICAFWGVKLGLRSA